MPARAGLLPPAPLLGAGGAGVVGVVGVKWWRRKEKDDGATDLEKNSAEFEFAIRQMLLSVTSRKEVCQ